MKNINVTKFKIITIVITTIGVTLFINVNKALSECGVRRVCVQNPLSGIGIGNSGVLCHDEGTSCTEIPDTTPHRQPSKRVEAISNCPIFNYDYSNSGYSLIVGQRYLFINFLKFPDGYNAARIQFKGNNNVRYGGYVINDCLNRNENNRVILY